jgi:predicted nucleic acid-binding protein
MLPNNAEVYLDANFLVAYFVGNHSDHINSVQLFASLVARSNILNLSPLTVDETLHAIQKEYNNLRKQQALNNKPHSFYYQQLKKVVYYLITSPRIKIRQFENNIGKGCLAAVENIKNFSLAPRDAFHAAYMQEWEIKYIVTNDSDFDSLISIGINKISF